MADITAAISFYHISMIINKGEVSLEREVFLSKYKLYSLLKNSKESRFFLSSTLVFLCMLCLLGCGTSADSLSVGGEEAAPDYALSPDISLEEWQRGTPEYYNESWTSDQVTYEYNAAVVLPDTEGFPIIRKEYQPLSEETVKRVVDYFTKDRKPVSLRNHSSYKMAYSDLVDLCRFQSVVAEIYKYRKEHNAPEYMEEDVSRILWTITDFGNKLRQYQDTYLYFNNDMPMFKPVDEGLHVLHEDKIYSSQTKIMGTEMAFRNRQGFYDLLVISDESDDPSYKQNHLHYISYDTVDYYLMEDECTFTRNQAILEAENILRELGIDNLIPGEVKYLAGYYTVYFQNKDDMLSYPTNISTLKPIPLQVISSNKASGNLYLMDSYNAYITLSQNHLREVCLPVDCPVSTVVDTVPYNEIGNFSEMMEYYNEQFQLVTHYVEEEHVVNDSTILVDDIRLLNMYYLKEWNEDGDMVAAVYESLPVWCFFGKVDSGIDTAQEAIMSPFYGVPEGSSLVGTVFAYNNYDYEALGVDVMQEPIYYQKYPYRIIQSGAANFVVHNMEISNVLR